MVNTEKVMTRMKERGVTQSDIAEKLDIARPTVSQKLRNVRPMFLDEAERVCELLGIGADEFGTYFFA